MSNDTPGVVSLEYIVHRVLMDREDNSMRYYKKYLQYAIDAYQELKSLLGRNNKSCVFTSKSKHKTSRPSC